MCGDCKLINITLYYFGSYKVTDYMYILAQSAWAVEYTDYFSAEG